MDVTLLVIRNLGRWGSEAILKERKGGRLPKNFCASRKPETCIYVEST